MMTRRLDCQPSGLLSSGSAGTVTANVTAGVAVVGMTPSAAVHGTVVDHDRPACVIDGSTTDRAFGSVFCGIAIHGWPLFLVVSQSISSRQGGRSHADSSFASFTSAMAYWLPSSALLGIVPNTLQANETPHIKNDERISSSRSRFISRRFLVCSSHSADLVWDVL